MRINGDNWRGFFYRPDAFPVARPTISDSELVNGLCQV